MPTDNTTTGTSINPPVNSTVNSTVNTQFQRALSEWQYWGLPQRPTLMSRFTTGKNHHTALVESAGQRYVLKHFNHSAKNAISAQRSASERGIAPRVIHHAGNVCLMSYVPNKEPTLSELAHSLKTLHSSVRHASGVTLDLMSCYDGYLASAPTELMQQHTALSPILNEFVNDATPWCFCHNDLVAENCLAGNNNTALFIDWEFAAHNNPWFDLASVILYQGLNPETAARFLEHYQGWQHKAQERIFLSSQIAVLWLDLLWHIKQYGVDYHSLNSERFEYVDELVGQLNLCC